MACLHAATSFQITFERSLSDRVEHKSPLSNKNGLDIFEKQEEFREPRLESWNHVNLSGDIIDIRQANSTTSLAHLIRDGLANIDRNSKTLPSLALWDSYGLDLYEQITQLPDYYLSWVERDILQQSCHEIARKLSSTSILVDLGCGDTQKTKFILQALDQVSHQIDYYALDLSATQLQTSITHLNNLSFRHIRCHGLLGTFNDAQTWLQTPSIRAQPKCLLSLGSTIGNMPRQEAATLLQGFVNALKPPTPSLDQQQQHSPPSQQSPSPSFLLIGLDACKDRLLVQKAYNDPSNLNARFLLNALKHSNAVLGYPAFDPQQWEIRGEWIDGGYSQSLVPVVSSDVAFEGTKIEEGERVHLVQSQKYDAGEQRWLWCQGGLKEVCSWASLDGRFGTDPMVSLLKVDETGIGKGQKDGS